ncbi:MarR family winged helix-turn-helix transcriptional regulator [Bacillus testis]|uniref:MarR family winged helix-turn-helix transcriptional regulator n=1 Tax=Bacillus testis TaxID=1622072 RepID=UPI00067F3E31|nr:MarR family transcriptional regulator [Bacillus testis]
MTTFIRRAMYVDQTEKKIGLLERSSYLLMRHLDEHGPDQVKGMAAAFRLDLSTISRQVAVLEKKQFIDRQTSKTDKRVSVFQLTPLGEKTLRKDRALRMERYSQIVSDWSPEERQSFGCLLERMNQAFFDL